MSEHTAVDVLEAAGVLVKDNPNIPPNMVIATTDRTLGIAISHWLTNGMLRIIALDPAPKQDPEP